MATELPKEYNFPYECIVVLGRGIERVQCQGKDVWKPTSLIARTDKSGAHTGYRLNDRADTIAMIGGSNANVLAAYHLFKSLSASGKPPEVIAFAAGRPQYLQKEPIDICEGAVLANKFISKLTGEKYPIPKFIDTEDYTIADIGLVKIILEWQNKNTFDDIKRSLEIAASLGIENMALITVEVHCLRSALIAYQVTENNPHLACIHPRFLSADRILSATSPRYQRIFKALYQSDAFKRNATRELLGWIRLVEGDYIEYKEATSRSEDHGD